MEAGGDRRATASASNSSADSAGNRVLVQDSFGGTTTSTYDAANQLVSELFTQQGMPTLRIDQTYTADGQVASQTRYSDAAGQNVVATSDYTYDFNGNETQIVHKSPTGQILAEYDYSYDEAGDLVSETDNGVMTNYQYDVTGQLVGYGNTTQIYDANGNRNGSGYVIGPDNQLLSDGTWDYSYDGEGNESTKTNIATGVTWTYGYDNRNELVSAVETAADGTVEVQADYKYDVFGNRIEKDVWTPAAGTVVTKFAYDAWNPNVPSGVGNENWNVWADLDGDNNLITRFFRGDALDQVFAQAGAGGTVAWDLTDNLGSTRVVVDNNGNVLDEVDYDAFGNIATQTNPAAEPQYMYTGREWDVETGLQYNRARYYDPGTGRWISQDPMGFDAGDGNLYRYVGNRPIENTDPSGLEPPRTPRAPEPEKKFDKVGKFEVKKFLAAQGWPREVNAQVEHGCKWLCMVRTGAAFVTGPHRKEPGVEPHHVPGAVGFTSLNDALAYQKVRLNNNTLRAEVFKGERHFVLIAIMVPNDQLGSLKRQTSAYATEVDPKSIPAGKGSGSFDFNTAFQDRNGHIKFWEHMNFGGGNVYNGKHRQSLVLHSPVLEGGGGGPGYERTAVYVVIEVPAKYWKYAPPQFPNKTKR